MSTITQTQTLQQQQEKRKKDGQAPAGEPLRSLLSFNRIDQKSSFEGILKTILLLQC
jgi:hypothetical protein